MDYQKTTWEYTDTSANHETEIQTDPFKTQVLNRETSPNLPHVTSTWNELSSETSLTNDFMTTASSEVNNHQTAQETGFLTSTYSANDPTSEELLTTKEFSNSSDEHSNFDSSVSENPIGTTNQENMSSINPTNMADSLTTTKKPSDNTFVELTSKFQTSNLIQQTTKITHIAKIKSGVKNYVILITVLVPLSIFVAFLFLLLIYIKTKNKKYYYDNVDLDELEHF